MSEIIEVKVPDIGDFNDVPVIDIPVKVGDVVKAEDSLVTLESDKATMDVPSPVSGVVTELKVKVGDKVAEGTLVALIAGAGATAAVAAPPPNGCIRAGSATTTRCAVRPRRGSRRRPTSAPGTAADSHACTCTITTASANATSASATSAAPPAPG